MTARLGPGFGLALFGATPTTALAPQGGGTFESAYTEAGPGPGEPVPEDLASRWRPQIRGAQTIALTATTIRGGFPGRTGARAMYRLATDTDSTDYRGWSPPNLVTGWSSPPNSWADGNSWTRLAMTVLPKSGIIVAIGQQSVGTDAMTWSFDPRTQLWTDRYDWAANQGLRTLITPCLFADPDVEDRVVLVAGSISYFSDDLGDTWHVFGRDSNEDGNIALEVAASPGADWLGVGRANDVQYASSDRGASWQSLEDLTGTATAGTCRALALPGGRFLIAYTTFVGGHPAVRVLSHARAAFGGSTEIVVDSDAARDASAVIPVLDDDGTVYLYTRDLAAGDVVRVYASKDLGQTWTRIRWGVLGQDSGANHIITEAAVASTGSVYLFGRGSVETDVHLVRLGGWSTSESGTSAPDYATATTERVGYGYYDGAGTGYYGGLYVPVGAPSNAGWTNVATGGTVSFSTGGVPGLSIATGAAEARTFRREVGSSHETGSGEAFLDTGSSSGTGVVYVEVELTDGTYSHRTQIRIGQNQVEAFDADTGVALAPALTINTLQGVHVRWHVTLGTASVLARLPTSTAWQVVCQDEAVTDGTPVAATDAVTWGHRAVGGGVDVSTWYVVGATGGGSFLAGIDGPSAGYASPTQGLRGLQYGGPVLGSFDGGYPIPDATGADGGTLGRLSATGGPTYVPERVGLPVAYEQGIHHTDPERSPSPRATWSASSDANQTLVYDLGDPVWLGGAIAVVALNVTTPTITIELDDGSGAWGSVQTMSMALVSVCNYTRTGRVLVPRAGTDTLDRYVAEGELEGAWLLCSTAGTPVFRRIASNSGGYWTTDTAKQQLRITLAEVDGNETAAGTGTLYHHSAVGVFYPTGDTARRFVRLKALAVTSGGVPSAGLLAPARIVGSGAEPDWTWTRSLELSRTLRRAGDDTPSVRRRGPPRQVWSYPWTGGLALRTMRLEASAAPHVAASGGVPIGTSDDTWHAWWAHIEHSLRSGEVPCVLLPALPPSSGVITDPSLFLYGLLAAESISVTSVVGQEGVDEIVRLDSPTIEQIR